MVSRTERKTINNTYYCIRTINRGVVYVIMGSSHHQPVVATYQPTTSKIKWRYRSTPETDKVVIERFVKENYSVSQAPTIDRDCQTPSGKLPIGRRRL